MVLMRLSWPVVLKPAMMLLKMSFQDTLSGRTTSRVKPILKDVGLDEERLALCNFTRKMSHFGEAAAEVLNKINELGKR